VSLGPTDFNERETTHFGWLRHAAAKARQISQIVTTLAGLVAVVAGPFAVFSYLKATQAKRAEWLASLHEKFFETGRYSRVRHVLDYPSEPQYDSLARAIAAEADHELADELYRYLNFFEFLGSLEELGQIQRKEIYALFDYDLRMIEKHPFILAVLSPQGFERLPRLLPSTGALPAPK
jgi:hypothetical protein